MTTETEESALIIQKIKKQKDEIIDEISNRQSPENLLEIQGWIKRIDLESPSINIFLIAITIDTIFFYIKNEFNKEKTSLVEKFLTNLINSWSNLPEHEILALVSYLKVYVKIKDANSHAELKKFIGKSVESTSFFRDISKKLVSFCEESLSNISTTIKTEFNSLSTVKLATEAGLPNQFPFFKKDASPRQFANDSPKDKKKLKPRVIEFDEEGTGYEFFNWYRCFLDNINLEIDFPAKIKRKLLQKELLKRELECLGKIEIEESYLNKLERKIKINEFDLFASKEEKDARQCKIEQKIRNNKKNRERKKNSKLLIPKILPILKKIDIYKKASDSQSLSIVPPLFETNKDDFLTVFLKSIDYEKFKELIKFSEYILISIDKIKQTLSKIDDFSEGLGIASNYVGFLESYYRKLRENFNRENISNFLEDSLILFEQRSLALDNNYCLLDIQAKKKEIIFSEFNFLDKFISANNNKQIYKILSNEIKQLLNKKRKNQTTIRNKNLKNKRGLIKKYFPFFYDEYYFTNKKFKKKFIKKIFSNIPEPRSIESMKTILDNLKWWQFFLIHIGAIFLLKKGFRVRLSEELFLDLLEEKFNKIDEKKEPKAKNIDELYEIKNHINFFDGKIQDHSIDLNSLNLLDSRQAIVDRLKRHKKVEDLLDNVLILSNQASNCINEFNNLKDACRRENEKIPENGETFHLNKNDVSKLHIPLKWMR